jgi:ADP-ribose pyrophosphatase
MTGFRRVEESLVHQGYIWSLATAEFESPDGERFSRDIVRSPGAVGVVPIWMDSEGVPGVLLVRQFRAAYEEAIIEIPAGMRDIPGELPEETARRELVEEIGMHAGRLEHLIDLYPSPGMTDSVTTVFLAQDLRETSQNLQGPEERHLEVLNVPLSEALAWVVSGGIRDAKTVAGLLLAERLLR